MTPHGVIRVRQLIELGVAETTIYDRCREGGPWQRLLPGVILLNNGHPTEQARVAAALLYGGRSSVLTGLLACHRHGIRRGPRTPATGPVHILVHHTRQLRASEFVVVERTRRPPRPITRNGVALAPVARACIDAARRLRSPGEVTELLADPIQRGLCSVTDLVTEVNSCGRRGTAVPRAVLAEVGSGVRSAAEREAQRLWRHSSLPEPWWNASVYQPNGELLGVADAWWEDVALAWEIDSYAYHLAPADYARTTERAARLTSAGVVLVPTLPERLRRDGAGVLAELEAAYRVAAARPRPPLRAVRAKG